MKNALNKFEVEELEDMVHEDYVENPSGPMLVSNNKMFFIGR